MYTAKITFSTRPSKDKVDKAMTYQYYTYDKLTDIQKRSIEANDGNYPDELLYDSYNLAPYNPFRCAGVKILIALLMIIKYLLNCGELFRALTTKLY